MDSSKKDSGRLVGLIDWLLSAFDLSAILPIGSSLLVLHSLPGPPIVRELMRVSMISSGQGMWFLREMVLFALLKMRNLRLRQVK